MPFNDQGVFDPLDPPAFPAVENTTIIAEYYNNVIADLIDGLSRTLLRDGLVPLEGDLDLGGNKLINGAVGTDPEDFVTLEQVEALVNTAEAEATMDPGAIQAFACRLPPSGWLVADGSAVSRSTFDALFAVLVQSSVATMTIASPCVVSWTNHTLRANDPVRFTTTGALPTGITAGQTYYVSSSGLTANTFQVSATPAGSVVNTSGSQSGVHTATCAPWGIGDGVTTFNLPDLRSMFLRGFDAGRGIDTGRGFGTTQQDAFEAHNHTGSTGTAGSHTHTGTSGLGGAHQHFTLKDTYGGPAGFVSVTNTSYVKSYTWDSFPADASASLGRSDVAADIGLTSLSSEHQHAITMDTVAAHSHTLTLDNSGDVETRPVNATVTYCIKT